MTLNKKAYILCFMLLLGYKTWAQDPYLSQQFTAAQFMSPASVGNGLYQNRIRTNIRSQFVNGNNLYRTIVGGWDTQFNNNNPDKNNVVGIGVQIVSDQLMNGILQTNNISLNVSNRIYLDDNSFSSIAIGLGANLSQVYLDKSKLYFGDQFDYRAIVSATSAESIKGSTTKLSGNMGFIYSWHSDLMFLQVSGNALYNTKGSLTNSVENASTALKPNFFVNLERTFGDDFTFLVHGSYSTKGFYVQKMLGGAVGFPIMYEYDKVRRVYMGCYTRLGDAYMPTVSLMMDQYIFGMSYDIYNNNLTAANLKPNSFEISFSASFGDKKRNLLRTLFD